MDQRYFAYLEEGKPLLILDLEQARQSLAAGRHSRPPRWSRQRVAVAMAAAFASFVAAAGLVVLPASAEAPSRVLQAVDVSLGNDGSLSAVKTTNIKRTKGHSSTDTKDIDPRAAADGLPVRVLTSYVFGSQTGSDLSKLKGVTGHVHITFTVQNTTVHPQLLTYDDQYGVRHERYALVAVPLTLTAAAVLPKGSFGRIAQRDPKADVLPGTADPSPVTNGVVGLAANGDTTVQWAALLAPPQLSSSATFELVEDAVKFQLPHFDLTVQPGLAADTSVKRLLDEAFRNDGASKLNLELTTITKIGEVSGVLNQAHTTLQQISDDLTHGAGVLGGQLVGQLASSADEVRGAAKGLSDNLKTLQKSLSDEVTKTDDATLRSLLTSIGQLSAYIGAPDGRVPAAQPITPGCDVTLADAGSTLTLYGQLFRVSEQLLTLASATSSCGDQIKADLLASLGDPTACTPSSTAIACKLQTVQGKLSDVASFVVNAGTTILNQFNPSAIDHVRTSLQALRDTVVDMQTSSGAIGGAPDSLQTQLDALKTTVTGMIAGLSPTGTGLGKALTDIHALANAHRATDSDSVVGQARGVAAAVCATPAALDPADPASAAYIAKLRALTTGTTCGVPVALPADATYPTPLVTRLTAEAGAWGDVADLTDLTAATPTGAAKEVADLKSSLQQLSSDIDDVGTHLSSPGSGLKAKLATLQAEVAGLYTAPGPDNHCPDAIDPTVTLPPLDALAKAFNVLDCNQAGLGTNLQTLLASASPTYQQAAADVGQAATDTNAARLSADASLTQLLDTLNGSLTTASAKNLADGGQVVDAQQVLLAEQAFSIIDTLDAATRDAVSQVAASVNASNTQVKASSDSLSKGIADVQTNLGTGGPNSGGLLGVILSNVSETGAGDGRVTTAKQTADRFSGVRNVEAGDERLLEAQRMQSLREQAALSPISLDLTPGSTSTSVFSFHLKGI